MDEILTGEWENTRGVKLAVTGEYPGVQLGGIYEATIHPRIPDPLGLFSVKALVTVESLQNCGYTRTKKKEEKR